jgi:Phosphotransferase enzyme family
MNDVPAEWNLFFDPGATGAGTRSFRVVRRRGEPLLLLPPEARAAAQTLGFYPAQTKLAKAARAALRLTLRMRAPVLLARVRLPWDDTAPLPVFLREQAGDGAYEAGVLLGNPRAEGRRWIIGLVAGGSVVRVVKAGVTARARELVAAEARCLSALPAGMAAVPKLRGRIEGGVAAIAFDFVPGEPPSANASREVSALLTKWLDEERDVALAEVPAWRRVRASDANPATVARLEQKLGTAPVAATIMHGDLAPWNIRTKNGDWTVLDWERGEMTGVPGWDWLHYTIQSDVLVSRLGPDLALRRAIQLTRTDHFREFAKRARIAGRERALLIGYLLHAVHAVRQTEGMETLREMLRSIEQPGCPPHPGASS